MKYVTFYRISYSLKSFLTFRTFNMKIFKNLSNFYNITVQKEKQVIKFKNCFSNRV